VNEQARAKAKILIWGGDLNVNPMQSDWSERAFDKIRSKIPEGELPAGCREKDVKSYKEMLQAMNGVNVAEHFGVTQKRTCFQNEWYFDKNFGHRIDVVVNREALHTSASQTIINFDVIVHFGFSLGVPDHRSHQKAKCHGL